MQTSQHALERRLAGRPRSAARRTETARRNGGRRAEARQVMRAVGACHRAVSAPAATPADLIEDVRAALGAGALVLLGDGGTPSDLSLLAAPDSWTLPTHPARLSHLHLTLRAARAEQAGPRIRRVAASLGMEAAWALVGYGLADSDRHHLVLAAWRHGEPLSPASMAAVAGALLVARAALEAGAGADRPDPSATAAGLAAVPETTDGNRDGLAARIEDLVEGWGIPVQVTVDGDVDRAAGRTASLAAAVVRETLANAAGWAAPDGVTVRLSATRQALFVSVDDGKLGPVPADPGPALPRDRAELALLARRVRDAGGTLHIEAGPRRGTRVVACLPIDEVNP